MAFCIALSLSLSPSPATPLNTEYLSTKTKQKGSMRALSHSDTDHYIELERGGRQFPSESTNFQKEEVLGVPEMNDTQRSARSSRAKSTWII